MENLKDKKLAFFMNYFSSLEIWDKFGMLEREIKLYNNLAKEFGHIYILTYGSRKDLEYQKYLANNISILPKKYAIPDALYELLLPFLQRKTLNDCDIYKTNQNSGAIAPAIAKLLYRKKFIVRSGYIGSEFARLNNLPLYAKAYFWLAENLSYRFCDQAFIPTQSGYDTLLKKYPVLNGKLEIMNNFVDTELFRKADIEKKYDIIYVARFDGKQKNHIGLLEATEGLGLKLLFIGQGEKKDFIIEKAREKSSDITVIEKVPHRELPNYFNSAKMCVFPSLFEGNPKTLLEAMSCELPIVACDVVGVNNIIENAKPGLLSPPDSLKIRENIQKIIADPLLAETLGQNAREFILENYAFDKIFAREINTYNNLLIKQ